MGAVNLLVAFGLGLSLDTWTTFKVFGGMGLMVVFVIAQAIYMSRYLPQDGGQTKDKQP